MKIRRFNWTQMSREETALIKAFGMILILFHNYSHLIKPWAGENEFTFSSQNIISFLTLLKHNPPDLLRLNFAFFGHYGVQLFIFVSGYGLFLSYRNKAVKWRPFFVKHLAKLYPAYILAIVLFFILFPFRYHSIPPPWIVKYAFLDLLFVQTFIPSGVYRLVGPWWFFSLIMQFYVIFPFILKAFQRYGIRAIIGIGAISWVVTVLVNPYLETTGFNLYYIFISRLPVFCLGITFAWLGNFKLSWWILPASIIVLLYGNYNAYIWPLTMLAATVCLLMIIRVLIISIRENKSLTSLLTWIGVNSLFIFAIHGFIRWEFVENATRMGNPYLTIFFGLTFFVVSLSLAWLMKRIEEPLQSRLILPSLAKGRLTVLRDHGS